MLNSLVDQFSNILDKVRGKTSISEHDLKQTLKDIRRALLEADVALDVIKDFLGKIQTIANGKKVIKSVNADQMIIKIVHDQLVELLGGKHLDNSLNLTTNLPAVIMLVGLQGTGKTTTSAKIASYIYTKLRKKVLIASLDTNRPAAQLQLQILAQQIGIASLPIIADQKTVDIANRALKIAKLSNYEVVILDTAGRLQIDTVLMQEIISIKKVSTPCEILLVADALAGQDTLNVAKKFHEVVDISGIVLSRMDGDSRGGVALSIRAATDAPLKFLGTGENINDLEVFLPDRLARRILGMGDVITFVEKAKAQIDESEVKNMSERLKAGQFNLDDLAKQLTQMRRMGGISNVMSMLPLPGVNKIKKQITSTKNAQFIKQESIIKSMTKQERQQPEIIHISRRKRIAAGSGVTIQDVNKLLKQFRAMHKMIKKVNRSDGSILPELDSIEDYDSSKINSPTS